jgi:MoxR-like ATPase
MVHATRPGTRWFEKKREGIIVAGASPRASIWLYKLARFRAFMEGKDFVTPEHVLSVVPAVLGHRVIPSYEAVLDKTNMRQLVKDIALSAL